MALISSASASENFFTRRRRRERAALVAEKSDHHPDWSNVYKTVNVTLSTHDSGGVTEKDIALARAMNAIAGQFGHT